jgi:pyruvate dehydrogenase E2 component (dihydrolipoamide acetyltransferase)
MAEVIMPKMSDAMTEGKVLSWRKHVGDAVSRGETIAEIETDKVNVEIEADASGTLSQVLVQEGESAPVGAVIAQIDGGTPAARSAAPQAPPAQTAPAQTAPSQTPQARPGRSGEEGAPQPDGPERARTAPPRPEAGGRLSREDGGRPVPVHEGPEGGIKASPIARRLAAERGVDLAKITGTGPGGRIVERDIEAYLGGAASGQAATATRIAPGAPPAAGEYEEVELPRMRQAIARVVTQSKQTIPHFYVTNEVDMTRALDLRAQLVAAYGEEQGRVSVNDLILKAAALALRRHPALNAQLVQPATLRRSRRVHLGIMVAIPDGLVLPVLRDADRLPLLALTREARRLIEGARQRRLRQEDYTGATFSVSNLGMYDVSTFIAIVHAPQAGILAVGRIQERPVARDGQVVVRPIMEMTVSADHRVTDGVGAAEFLVEVKRLLENPVLLVSQE